MISPSFKAACLFLKLMPSLHTPPLEVDFASSNLTPLYHYWQRWRHPSSLSHYVNLCPVYMGVVYAPAHFIIPMIDSSFLALTKLSLRFSTFFLPSVSVSKRMERQHQLVNPARPCLLHPCYKLLSLCEPVSSMQHRIKRSI